MIVRRSALCLVLTACVAAALPRTGNRTPAIVGISQFAFKPPELTMAPGDTLIWVNDDPFAHTVAADSGAWTSPELGQGQRYMFVARRAGRFAYHCALHPVMRGVLVVLSER